MSCECLFAFRKVKQSVALKRNRVKLINFCRPWTLDAATACLSLPVKYHTFVRRPSGCLLVHYYSLLLARWTSFIRELNLPFN